MRLYNANAFSDFDENQFRNFVTFKYKKYNDEFYYETEPHLDFFV